VGYQIPDEALEAVCEKTLLGSFQKTEFLYPTLHIAKAGTTEDHVHMIAEVAPRFHRGHGPETQISPVYGYVLSCL
jgi:hypothetical protein